MNREIFLKMSSWSQLLFLCLFMFIGLILVLLTTTILAIPFIANGGVQDMSSLLGSTQFLRIAQLTQQLFLFLFPACLCAFLFNKQPISFLKINTGIDFKFLFLALILLLVFQPIVSFTAFYNDQMILPDFLKNVEAWMRTKEIEAESMMSRLMIGDSVVDYAIIFLIVAVMAAIVEEFLFRGVLQQLINRITRNYHVAIWISAFIFSAIHMQFYGFIPRMLLGALLGYMFVWSNNIWVPVIIHFFNNALSVVQYKLYYGTADYQNLQHIGTGSTWWITLVSALVSGVILIYLSKEYTLKKQYKDIG